MSKLAIATLVTILWALPAAAESEPRINRLADEDQEFVTKAAEGGKAEIEMAKLAERHGESPEVKKFAEHMIRDHTKSNAALERLASAKGAVLPKGPGAAQTLILEDLKDLRSAEFDAAYVKAQIEAHRQMSALLEKQARSGRDPDLRKFATATLATVEKHEKMAEGLDGRAP